MPSNALIVVADSKNVLKLGRDTPKTFLKPSPKQQSTLSIVIGVPNAIKKVEPPVTDALPGSTLGLRVLVLSAWLHFALGNTLGQIVEVFNFHLQMKITPGGLIQMWYRLQELLFEWYQQIHTEAMQSAVLDGDETGWRVDGKTHWLWCFSNPDTTFLYD